MSKKIILNLNITKPYLGKRRSASKFTTASVFDQVLFKENPWLNSCVHMLQGKA